MASGDNVQESFWQLEHSLSSQNFPHNISKTSSYSFTRW